MNQNLYWIIIGITALFFIFSCTENNSPEALEQHINELAHRLRCPVCQGLSVKESNTGISVDMKNKIRSLLLEKKTDDQILEYFEIRYGEWILREPRKKGFNLLLWILPGIVFLIGCGTIFWFVRRNTSLKVTHENKNAFLTPQEQKDFEDTFNQKYHDD